MARSGVRIRLGDAVSDAVAGLDQLDGEWFVDHRAQAVEVHAQRVGVRKLPAPDAGLKLLPGHHTGGGLTHRLQDLSTRGGELQPLARQDERRVGTWRVDKCKTR